MQASIKLLKKSERKKDANFLHHGMVHPLYQFLL